MGNWILCVNKVNTKSVDFQYKISLQILASGIILCMCPANERQRYIVTSSLIGWAHTQNDHWKLVMLILNSNLQTGIFRHKDGFPL